MLFQYHSFPAGKYKVELYDDKTEQFIQKQNIGMHVDIKDPDNKVLLSKYYTNEGQFVFTTHTPGEHKICLSPNSTRWFSGGSRLVSHSLHLKSSRVPSVDRALKVNVDC